MAGFEIRREEAGVWSTAWRGGWIWFGWRRILKVVLVYVVRGVGRRKGRRVAVGTVFYVGRVG